MERFIAAAIQLNSKDQVEDNLKSITELVDAAAGDGAQLVVLPEYANYLSDDNKVEHAEALDGATISAYQELASKHQIYLHCGSFLEKSDIPEKCYNTSVFLGPDGTIIATYRKIHLFDICIAGQPTFMESKYILPGKSSVVAETSLAKVGMTICYDLRFPHLFQKLTDKGANIITTPAAFTLYTGKDHWEPLLRARAIENEVFVIAPGQWGLHPNSKACYGSSMIIDPWGTVLARASEGVGYITAPIDLTRQVNVRNQIPCLANRREFK